MVICLNALFFVNASFCIIHLLLSRKPTVNGCCSPIYPLPNIPLEPSAQQPTFLLVATTADPDVRHCLALVTRFAARPRAARPVQSQLIVRIGSDVKDGTRSSILIKVTFSTTTYR